MSNANHETNLIFGTPGRLIALALLAFGVIAVAEGHFGASSFVRAHIGELVILVPTLETGHFALSYFFLVGDPAMRREFPWAPFLALKIALFLVVVNFQQNVYFSTGLFFVIRVFSVIHTTQQNMGVSLLWGADLGTYRLLRGPVRRFVSRARYFLLLMPLLYLLGSFEPLSQVLLCMICLGFFFLALQKIQLRQGLHSKNASSLVLLSRLCFMPLGNVSTVLLNAFKSLHGLEFFYVYFRFFKRQNRLFGPLFCAGLFCAGLVQAAQAAVVVNLLGWIHLPWRVSHVLTAFVSTTFFMHMAQDWIMFRQNKIISARVRTLLGVVPLTGLSPAARPAVIATPVNG